MQHQGDSLAPTCHDMPAHGQTLSAQKLTPLQGAGTWAQSLPSSTAAKSRRLRLTRSLSQPKSSAAGAPAGRRGGGAVGS